jgi:hypothetical protein
MDANFDTNNMIATVVVYVVYIAVYGLLGMWFRVGDQTYVAKNILAEAIAILLLLLAAWFTVSTDQDLVQQSIDWAKSYAGNPFSLLQLVLFMIAFTVTTMLLRVPDVAPVKAIIIFVAVGFYLAYKHGMNVDLLKEQKKDDTTTEEKHVQSGPKEEVFNVSNNLYTYEDAGLVCSALGARLANYDEIEAAYNNGAEWGTYGWSEGQHAYFPTQKDTWQKLQSVKGHEHDLGRPGVNGGYFANPQIRFGVNCYGVKPAQSDTDKTHMDARKTLVYAKSPEDVILDKKVKFFMDNKDKIMVINGFNNDKWSKY